MIKLSTATTLVLAVEHIGSGLLILDADERIEYCNTFIVRHSLQSKEQLIGTVITDAFPQLDPALWRRLISQACMQEQPLISLWHETPHLLPLFSYPAQNPEQKKPMLQTVQLFRFCDNAKCEHFGLAIFDSDRTAQASLELNQALHALSRNRDKLDAVNNQLQQANSQLLQSEKLAAIGQLSAGIAHEINNPTSFVASNLNSLGDYVKQLLALVDALPNTAELDLLKREFDYHYIREDINVLLAESADGVGRIKKIISSLRDFSHVDDEHFVLADIGPGIDSTLNVVNNEIKYKAHICNELAPLPLIECIPSQLNQVFMNLLINAAQAIADRGRITLRSGHDAEGVWVEVEDNGCGMSADTVRRIFEPFFTTKPVGKGTGLGLSLSYNIVQKHSGRLTVDSRVGEGTRFRVWLPLRQPQIEGRSA
ncbi:ATP-binding protein [Pseudomonas kuykendallii]|uniref:histidine kinase n=1 Tax=Pseudomonas kuykendallii TaxID=1007099 RepID=A0A1H2ZUW0_9PSED|nr:ATP-binding protein [Pseudomonas kuykendallii]MCQ4272045.1 ATP-binding protein [Pseudomonas kuykendallii]SDX21370.1 PAS fold-containing protein [Pseudomonas kuykendallii]